MVAYKWYWDKDNESRKESWESMLELDIHLTDQMALISLDGSASVLLLLVPILEAFLLVCVGARGVSS